MQPVRADQLIIIFMQRALFTNRYHYESNLEKLVLIGVSKGTVPLDNISAISKA